MKKCLLECICVLILITVISCNHAKDKIEIKGGNMKNYINRKNFFILNQLGIDYKIFILNKEDVRAIFQNETPAIVTSNELLSDTSLTAYTLLNGEVLIVRDGENEFPLYPSLNVLSTQINGHKSSKDLLEGINIYGKDLPLMADKIYMEFLNKCKIDSNNTTSNIISDVDKYLNKNRTQDFLNRNLLSLVCLIGNIVNKECGTKWVMVKTSDSNVWNPCLTYNNKNIFFVDYIIIDFQNKNEQKPILQTFLSIKDIIKANLSN